MCGNYGDIPIKPGSMGKPLPGIPLHVIQHDGKEIESDEEGELALLLSDGDRATKFFGIFDGYVDDSGKATRRERVSNNKGTIQRWYMTGDKARRDKDGYFWFVGRADDVINSSGYRIGMYPAR